MCLAVTGMVMYGYFSSRPQPPPAAAAAAAKEEATPLLPPKGPAAKDAGAGAGAGATQLQELQDVEASGGSQAILPSSRQSSSSYKERRAPGKGLLGVGASPGK